MIVVLMISLYTARVVLNTLGIIDYGIYNVVAGFVSLFSIFNTSLSSSIQRFYNFIRGVGSAEELTKAYNTSLQIQVLLAFSIFLILEIIGIWYINHKLVLPVERLFAAKMVFHFSAISLVLLLLQIPYTAMIIAHEKMGYFAIVNIIDAFLKLIVVIVLPILTYDKLIVYGGFMLGISLFNFASYYIYSKYKFEQVVFVPRFNAAMFKKMLSFAGWNLFESVAIAIQGPGVNVILNYYVGPSVNAARGVASQVYSAVRGFSENVSMAFKPQIVGGYAQGNIDRTRLLFFSLSKICYLLMFLLSTPILIELEYILDTWLKGTVPPYTVIFTRLVLIELIIRSINMPMSIVCQATGNIRNYQLVRSFVTMLNLPLALLFMELGCSPVSVFWASLILTIISQPVSLYLLHNVFVFSYVDYLKGVVLPCILFSLLMPIIPILCHYNMGIGFMRLAVVVIGSVLPSIFLVYFVVLNSKEKDLILSFVKDKFLNRK